MSVDRPTDSGGKCGLPSFFASGSVWFGLIGVVSAMIAFGCYAFRWHKVRSYGGQSVEWLELTYTVPNGHGAYDTLGIFFGVAQVVGLAGLVLGVAAFIFALASRRPKALPLAGLVLSVPALASPFIWHSMLSAFGWTR
jgi:hypothetical protein